MQTALVTAFADGEYTFQLLLPEIGELQKKTGVGLGKLYARLLSGRYVDKEAGSFGYPPEAEWAVADLLETIRLALIGGGKGTVNGSMVTVDPPKALDLMATYCYPARPLNEAWTLATAILTAAVEGLEDSDEHPVKKKSVSARTRKGTSTIKKPSAT